jgi:hypothetical protein
MELVYSHVDQLRHEPMFRHLIVIWRWEHTSCICFYQQDLRFALSIVLAKADHFYSSALYHDLM